MSIASEITRINSNIAAAYAACSGKGATLPTLQNSANLADAIDDIPTGADIAPITDAIRKKTGVTGEISPVQAELDILAQAARPVQDIPAYIRTEANRVAALVKSHQTANSVSFICCSDAHEDTSETVSAHAAMAAYLVRQYVPIDFGIFLGDYVRGGSSDTEESTIAQFKTMLPLLSWWADAMTQGNHDNGMAWWDGFLGADTLYSLIGRHALHAVRPATQADRGYYYFDVPEKDFRVIVLNTNDHKGITFKDHSVSGSYNDGHRVSVDQLNWFAQTLAAIPNGYRFIVCSHEPIHWFDYTYTDSDNVTWDMAQKWRTILDAYVGGTSFSFSQDGQTVSGDFSSAHSGVCCGTFHGHTHNFIDGVYGDNNIVRVSTPNLCNGRTNTYGSASQTADFRQKYGELDENGDQVTAYFKTAPGTTNETAFVVNTIDFDNGLIYSDYYGAGRNRVISFGAKTYYNITAQLGSHAVLSNHAVAIESGESYSTTVDTDLSTYSVKSVAVTMGGVDITSTVYASGQISIPAVTGNVVITVMTSGYTNLASEIGYTPGMRISTSTGENTARVGCLATGFIPCKVNDVIRVYGYDFRKASSNSCTYVLCDSTKVMIGSGYNIEVDNSSFKMTFDASGNLTFIPRGGQIAYIRVGGLLGDGDAEGNDLIITINEEIV